MNFTIDELCYSDTAKQKNIKNVPYLANTYNNLMRLVVDVLQPLRNYLKKPIKITSGYRCHDLNVAVKGAWNSQHQVGEAVDIVVTGYLPIQIADIIKQLKLPYDQMIIEPSWLHISLKASCNRKEIIKNA